MALPRLSFPSMGVEEFLEWEPGGQLRWQLVDGVPMAMAPASAEHGVLQANLSFEVTRHLRATGSPCFVLIEPGVVPKARASENVRIPDLAVSCSPIEDRIVRAPVLLAEILSPSNASKTWNNVWAYTTIPSVREIVVLYSEAVRADVLRRRADGAWPDDPDYVTEGELVLEGIGLRTPLVGLYRNTRLYPERPA